LFQAPRRGVSGASRGTDDFLRALAVGDRDVIALPLAGVDLARPAIFCSVSSFISIHWRPSRRCGDGEDHVNMSVGSRRLVDDPRVEVDVGVELARGEVLVVEGALLELTAISTSGLYSVASKTSSMCCWMIRARGS